MSTTVADRPAALSVRGLSKTFQGQQALRQVALDLQPGEIHCLLGQNGSGKSTLIKILAGYHTPDPGSEASVFGTEVEVGPHMAEKSGLRFIHQDLGMIDSLSVADNMSLGGSFPGRFWLSDRQHVRHSQAILDSYGVKVDAAATIGELSLAARTLVAVVRALHFGPAKDAILVLDEPTAALAEADKQLLFTLLREVQARGQTILYVTHLLQEVFELGDRVTILRNGSVVATRPLAGLDHDSLIELILGRKLEALYPDHEESAGVAVLQAEHLAGGNVKDLSLSVRAGEIVGVVGLMGSGAEDVPHLLFGSRPRAAGVVRVDGRDVPPDAPAASIRAGIAFSPGERKRLAVLGEWSVRENITLPRLKGLGRLRWMSRRAEGRDVAPYVAKYGVHPRDPEMRLASLSGGNQQKVVIARWMRSGAHVFLLEEPTAGVDVGAKRAIYDAILQAAAGGSAILLMTSDFDEAASMCDRVLVLRDGVLGASVPRAEATTDRLLGESISRSRSKDSLHV
ncbi:sugar ABC transporter ATP-binding protein [Trujillonella endophytica]|uniref:Ribose transport system ATP-binding protein n=1 Tax=Trujillonella endophytica TaxID=673521 RepID=A0A1H8QTC8_9ACTN|nr:sugar ABC transporter ATP-binding protein [Trujillella endophytica]SEO57470.1 ribose transport system ATP-binding protein [Trujillella endophytica]